MGQALRPNTKVVAIRDDGTDPRLIPPPSVSLTYAIKQLASGWGPQKNQVIDGLVSALQDIQDLVAAASGNWRKKKNDMSSNIKLLNDGKIRVVDDTSLPDPAKANQTINAALAGAYSSGKNISEVADIQRATELSRMVRAIESVTFFDSGRSNQISAKMNKWIAEADRLVSTLETIKASLEKEKD